MSPFRVAADGRYEIVDASGEIVHVYERIGHALHHVVAGHPTAPVCCSRVNRNGDVRADPEYGKARI